MRTKNSLVVALICLGVSSCVSSQEKRKIVVVDTHGAPIADVGSHPHPWGKTASATSNSRGELYVYRDRSVDLKGGTFFLTKPGYEALKEEYDTPKTVFIMNKAANASDPYLNLPTSP